MVKKIAVIGAGPGGLAAAKYLVAENAFLEVIIFEQRLNVGGVWNATPTIRTEKHLSIPQTKPSIVPDDPISQHTVERNGRIFEFPSPIYDNLDTNIPQMLMKYSDHAFPEGTPLFPRHDSVLEYLERYANEVRHLIRFGTQVLDVHPITESDGREKWSVTTRNIQIAEVTVSDFDAVVVANGHYNDPYVPDIAGIREWNAAYPGSISHSKSYRRPEDFKDKKVLIVGNSASGTDLAAQIAPHCTAPLLISSRSPPTQFPPSPTAAALTVSLPEIAHFNARNHTILFTNSHLEPAIDVIVFCTGYLYSLPFLASLSPPLLPPNGTRVQNLYQHIFYRHRPTLSFIALPQRIIPFPLSEAQASVIARFLSGRLALPCPAAMSAWEADLLADRARCAVGAGAADEGVGKFHLLGYPADARYINELHDWALSASPRFGRGEALANGGRGKIPPYWSEEEQWIRERTPLIKRAAREVGARKRGEIRTLAELGFDFAAWKRGEGGEGDGTRSGASK